MRYSNSLGLRDSLSLWDSLVTSSVTRTLDTANRVAARRIDARPPRASSGRRGARASASVRASGPSVSPAARGPVVLVGGLATTDSGLQPMARWLRELGHDVTTWSVGNGLSCARPVVEALAATIAEVADAAGEPVRLVGHSRGGQFARAAGRRESENVAALVTLGTPFDAFGVSLPMLGLVTGLATAGSFGFPGLFRLGCLVGACCRAFREDLRAPWPAAIPFTSIYSRTDEAVPSRSSRDPWAREVIVPGSHVGLLGSRTGRRAVADALVRVPTRHPRLRPVRGEGAVALAG